MHIYVCFENINTFYVMFYIQTVDLESMKTLWPKTSMAKAAHFYTNLGIIIMHIFELLENVST